MRPIPPRFPGFIAVLSTLLLIPKTPSEDGKYGLMVVMPLAAHGFPPREWIPVLEKHHVIWLGDSLAGDNRPPLHRIGLALDAVHNAQKFWPINPARVYVCPASSGPVAPGIALYYPDVFQGAFCPVSTPWFAKIPDPRVRAIWNTDNVPRPLPEQIALAKSRSRFYFATRESSTPDKMGSSELIVKEGYQRAGFTHVKYVAVPQNDITVWSAYKESWFEPGFEFLDTSAAEAKSLLKEIEDK